jgi:carboxyl-terminal processing protease
MSGGGFSFGRRLRAAAFAPVLAFALALSACETVPFEKDGVVPPAVRPAEGSAARTALNVRVYDTAVRYVREAFYRPDFGGLDFAAEASARRDKAIAQPDEDGFYAELEALLDLVDDDHTYSQSPTERERRDAWEAGEARPDFGIGASREGEDLVVSRVRPDGPAAAAGVLEGWRVETVAGRPALLAPPPQLGRTDLIVFVDENDGRHEIELTPILLEPRPVFETRRLDDDIAYIRFDLFETATFEKFRAEIAALAAAPPRGLIIDLRGNRGGGLGLTGRSLAQLFDEKIPYVVTLARSRSVTFSVEPSSAPYLGPVTIIVGPNSGSGGELFPAVAQERGRAAIVGRTTRGAVIGTRGINLPDGGLLNVGMLDMTTPGGKRLEKIGVAPDVAVDPDWLAVRQGRDPTLDAAVVVLEGRIAASAVPDPTAVEASVSP